MDPIDLSPKTFEKFRKLVYERAGISLSTSKQQLLKSRLQKRIRALGLKTFESYYDVISGMEPNHPEAIEFVNAVTTNKTDFFRENHHFQFAVQNAFPQWMAAGERRFKVWHAGCSTGEEPYSLKIALAESGLNHQISVSQLATDIDTRVLEHAENGIYEAERIQTIAVERVRKFFLKGKGGQEGCFRVRPELQEDLLFKRLNLNEMPWPFKPTTTFDLIFCRNVLIYFDRETQHRLVEGFYRRLRPGGYLFLGHSESIHGMTDELKSLGQTIYQSQGTEKTGKQAA